MKKLLVVSTVVLFGFSFVSCDKKCKCTTYKDGEEVSTSTKKKDKDESCANFSLITGSGNTKTGIECK
jgi:hypothetical protein